MTTEVFAHLSGSNLGFLCRVTWQDPAKVLLFFILNRFFTEEAQSASQVRLGRL